MMNKIDDVFETIGQTSPQLCLIHEGNGNPVFPQSGKIFRCNIQVQRRDCACLINGLKKHALLAVSWRRRTISTCSITHRFYVALLIASTE